MQRGFSLVELSIVLVILGLLTGGILAGQSLIRASELRSFSNDLQRFTTAIGAFRDQFSALPGDMRDATRFWGAADPTPGTCRTTPSTTTTCNGNGDGMIRSDAPGSYESFRLWQQLALAGMLEGSYTGVGGPGGADHSVPGRNVPRGRLEDVGYFPISDPAYVGDTYRYDGNYKNHFRIGRDDGAGWNNGLFMKPEELWNVDTKLDDGSPAYGAVRGWKPAFSACTTGATSSTGAYALSNSGKVCAALYITGY